MSKISLEPNASGAGTFSIVSPNSNTNRTLNLPDESGILFSDGSGVPGSAVTGQLASSNMPAGSVIQAVQAVKTDSFQATTSSFVGTGLSASVTPSSASNKILILFSIHIDTRGSDDVAVTIFRDSQNLGDSTWGFIRVNGSFSGRKIATHSQSFLDAPSTTSLVAYEIHARGLGGNNNFIAPNSQDVATIQLMEIAG